MQETSLDKQETLLVHQRPAHGPIQSHQKAANSV